VVRWSLPGFCPAVERSCVGAGRLRLSDQTRRAGGTLDAPHNFLWVHVRKGPFDYVPSRRM